MTLKSGVRSAASVIAVALIAAGCGGSAAINSSASERFPTSSLQDWISYADHIAVYTVVAEREIPPSPEEIERGEGMIGREITLRVEQTLWSAARAPELPGEFRATALGWAFQNGEKTPFDTEHGGRVEVGKRYVSPLTMVEDDPAHPWWPLTQLPVDGDEVAGGPPTAAKERLDGRSFGEIRAVLARQAPDPAAARHFDLRPTERIRAVLDDKGDVGTPAPSERR